MDRHLVAVKVGVERLANERVDLNRLALNQSRLEGLDAEPVQGRCTVQEHRPVLDHFFEDVPDLRARPLNHPFCALDVVGVTADYKGVHNKRLEQFKCHLLRQATLVQLELRANDDDRTAGVVDTLAEQVLPETALLAPQEVGQRLQFVVVATRDRPATPAVVNQRVYGFLQHALLVADDDLRRL